MSRRLVSSPAIALLLLAAGCASFPAPTPYVLEIVDRIPAPPGPFVRVRGKVTLSSAWLSGTFTGAMVVRGGADPAVRLKCFPDLGGKALDMLVQPSRIVGYVPALNQGCDVAMPASEAPNPVTMMGVSMLEFYAPVTRERVLGARPEGDGWWLLLRPIVQGVRVMVRLEPDGRISRKRFEWNHGVRWEEELPSSGALVFRSLGVELRVEQSEAAVVDSVPGAIFELALPAGTKPIEMPR